MPASTRQINGSVEQIHTLRKPSPVPIRYERSAWIQRIPPGDDQTVRSETTVPVAQRSDLLGIDHRRPAAVGNQKIIAAALIFFQNQTLHSFLQQSILPGPFADLHGIGRRPLAQLIAAAP